MLLLQFIRDVFIQSNLVQRYFHAITYKYLLNYIGILVIYYTSSQ